MHAALPGALMIAEESTTFPRVTRPTYEHGLGFDFKWMMGWMNDTLKYFKTDPYFRKGAHHSITFSMHYAYTEKFILPLSHDEVVHGKASMIYKMAGDEQMQFASLRLLYTYMFTHPGGKLLFMGDEFAQTSEWNHNRSLSWELLKYPLHKGMQDLIRELNSIYRKYPALHEQDFIPEGFSWVIADDSTNSVLVYQRRSCDPKHDLLIILNCSPLPLKGYHITFPVTSRWKAVFYSNHITWAGRMTKAPSLKAVTLTADDKTEKHFQVIDLQPYDALIFKKSATRHV